MIRPYADADRAQVRAVVTAAFDHDGGEDAHGPEVAELTEALRAGSARAELVLEEEGEVVGHVLLSRSWVDARRALVEVLVLSPLSVRPDRQGAGLGTALVAAAIAEAARLGAPAVFLEGSPAYYGTRGFSPGADHGFTPPSVRVPGPAFQVAVLAAHEEWMTGALVYCEPFWTHDCVGLRDPRLAEIEQMFD